MAKIEKINVENDEENDERLKYTKRGKKPQWYKEDPAYHSTNTLKFRLDHYETQVIKNKAWLKDEMNEICSDKEDIEEFSRRIAYYEMRIKAIKEELKIRNKL